jgi:ribosomal protein S14
MNNGVMQPVSKQRLGKHVPTETNTRATIEERCFRCGQRRGVILKTIKLIRSIQCGGGFEYLHRSPANRRRRRKGKSRIWDSRIWSRVPRDSDPKMIELARTSSNYSRQRERPTSTNSQVSESNKNLVISPRWVLYSKTDWPTDRRS